MCFKTLCELISAYPLALTTTPPSPTLFHLTIDSLRILFIYLSITLHVLLSLSDSSPSTCHLENSYFLFKSQGSLPTGTSLDNGPWLPQTHLGLSTLVLLLNSLPTSAIAIIYCGLLYAHLSSHYSIDFFREWAKFFYVYIHSTQILLKEIINYNRYKYKS